MSVREGRIAGVPTRLARVSFTGEMGFEVNVPTDYGLGVQEAIWAEAEKRGACAYGLDTLLMLRAEKGFIVVGQETDGTVTPDDVGMGSMIAMSKPDFVGKRSLSLPDLKRAGAQAARRPARRRSRSIEPDEGEQIVASAQRAAGRRRRSATSLVLYQPDARAARSAWRCSPTGARKIGADASTRPAIDGARPAKVVEPVFYDKEGLRLDA